MNPQLPHQTDFGDLVVQHPEDGRKSATQTYSPVYSRSPKVGKPLNGLE